MPDQSDNVIDFEGEEAIVLREWRLVEIQIERNSCSALVFGSQDSNVVVVVGRKIIPFDGLFHPIFNAILGSGNLIAGGLVQRYRPYIQRSLSKVELRVSRNLNFCQAFVVDVKTKCVFDVTAVFIHVDAVGWHLQILRKTRDATQTCPVAEYGQPVRS